MRILSLIHILLARIRAVLRRSGGSSSARGEPQCRAYRFNGWTLDLTARHLRDPEGMVVNLSGAESVSYTHLEQVTRKDGAHPARAAAEAGGLEKRSGSEWFLPGYAQNPDHASIHSHPIRRLTPRPTDRRRTDCPFLTEGIAEKDFIGFAVLSTELFSLKGGGFQTTRESLIGYC